jgi:hypothetical protein
MGQSGYGGELSSRINREARSSGASVAFERYFFEGFEDGDGFDAPAFSVNLPWNLLRPLPLGLPA